MGYTIMDDRPSDPSPQSASLASTTLQSAVLPDIVPCAEKKRPHVPNRASTGAANNTHCDNNDNQSSLHHHHQFVAPTSHVSDQSNHCRSVVQPAQNVTISFQDTCSCGGNQTPQETRISVQHFGNSAQSINIIIGQLRTVKISNNCSQNCCDNTVPGSAIINVNLSPQHHRNCDTSVCPQHESAIPLEQLKLRRIRHLELVKQCGFYHGALSMQDARKRLKRASIGSFLLRDSSDERYFMSLSIKTDRGTTSIRISDSDGRFRLDCESTSVKRMPSFDCVLKLVDYYVERARINKAKDCVFLESSGRKDTPVLLRKAFLAKPPSLMHLARLQLNNMLDEERKSRVLTFMPPEIEEFLKAYPNKV